MKRRQWVWIGGALLVVLLCAAILNPVAPYKFLSHSDLQYVQIMEAYPSLATSAPAPITVSYERYALKGDYRSIVASARRELLAEGWLETKSDNRNTRFAKSDSDISIRPLARDAGRTREIVVLVDVLSPATLGDRLLSKLYRVSEAANGAR